MHFFLNKKNQREVLKFNQKKSANISKTIILIKNSIITNKI